MKTHLRTALATGVIAATMGTGCVAIIATDSDDHYAEDCSYCHEVIVYKPSPGGDSTAVALDTMVTGVCAR
jgi:hypothetical protein